MSALMNLKICQKWQGNNVHPNQKEDFINMKTEYDFIFLIVTLFLYDN